MKQEDFEALVTRLEKVAVDNPARYTVSVIGVALLGFLILGLVIGFSVVLVLLLLGLGVLVVATGGKALIVLVKLGKLLIALALPAWVMIKSSSTLLFARFVPPRGRELKREEAPRLYAHLDRIKDQWGGPRIHHVLLTDEMNAAIAQHPRFGLVGWEKSYLILGLPLLQTLSEGEALSVIAHEYGHLSGHHGRLGGFIYRFRSAWGNLQALSEQWTDWGSRLIARLFKWYAPYFNAYTFVFARQNEYVADRCSVEIAGQQATASALVRVNVASLYRDEKFWPSITRRIAEEPTPVKNRSGLWQDALASGIDQTNWSQYLDVAGQRKTDHLDTHPALRDRLSAMGVALDTLNTEPDKTASSAANLWLDPRLESIQSELDKAWEDQVSGQWEERHAYLKTRGERMAALNAQQTLTADEQWELIALLDELEPETEPLSRIEALLGAAPDHLPALFRRGALLLDRGDESGMADLEKVMQSDDNAILPGCEAAWRFYRDRAPEKAAEYQARWQARSDYQERVAAELKSLSPKAKIAPAEIDAEAVNAIGAILDTHKKWIKRAYVFRRVLESDSEIRDYVLGFETRYFTFGDKGAKVSSGLATQTFPFPVFIVSLKNKPYNAFRKQIERLGIAPIYPVANSVSSIQREGERQG